MLGFSACQSKNLHELFMEKNNVAKKVTATILSMSLLTVMAGAAIYYGFYGQYWASVSALSCHSPQACWLTISHQKSKQG